MFSFLQKYCCVFLLICSTLLQAQNNEGRLRISLLTCTPGEELNETFGHSALRVIDSNAVTDHVYNYGTFDFEDPNFYVKFVRGQLRYFVAIDYYPDFVGYYQSVNRGVTEQVLALSATEKMAIKRFLVNNVKEENKYYQYDFFKDNCTTRLRDIIQKNSKPAPSNAFIMPKNFTYRNAIHQYLNMAQKPWSKLGIDILLGAKTDAVMTANEQQFLPDNLMLALDSSTSKKIVAAKKQLFVLPEIKTVTSIFTPLICSVLFAIIFFGLYFFANNKKILIAQSTVAKRLDVLLFIIVGLLGALLIFMWWGTDHVMTKNNYNLLWASPLYFIFLLFSSNKVVKKIALIFAVMLSLLVLFWWAIPQQLNVALIPVVILLAWRLFIFSKQNI
jgi:hypothetical protein